MLSTRHRATLEAFAESNVLIAFDFDGTLAAICEEPAKARMRASTRFESPSERERKILQLIAEGYTNKEVADSLSVGPVTVQTHRVHILQKLDVHDTAELVLYAVRRGMIS